MAVTKRKAAAPAIVSKRARSRDRIRFMGYRRSNGASASATT